jgi:hypothetical protein
MKRLALCLLILQACPTRAEQYTLSHTTTCRVYRIFGEVFDASTMHGEIQFALTDGKRICADPRTMKLRAQDGSKMLQMQPEVREVFSHGPADFGSIPPTNLDLTDGKTIRWSIGDQAGSGADWTEVDRQICLKYSNKQLDLAAIMPGSWLLTKAPFVFHVDQGLKIGDEVTIPFRRPLNPKGSFGSTDRTDKLTCISLDNRVAILTSNLTFNIQDMFITWHVRVEYDVNKGLFLRAVEEHFQKLRSHAPLGEIHTTLDVIRCELQK